MNSHFFICRKMRSQDEINLQMYFSGCCMMKSHAPMYECILNVPQFLQVFRVRQQNICDTVFYVMEGRIFSYGHSSSAYSSSTRAQTYVTEKFKLDQIFTFFRVRSKSLNKYSTRTKILRVQNVIGNQMVPGVRMVTGLMCMWHTDGVFVDAHVHSQG